MPRYNGVAAQSILDRYAALGLTAQQWFTQDDPQYWAFTLFNNGTDGSQLYLYDARARSSADAYPDGTGNPSGNPNPIIGGGGGGGAPANNWATVSESNFTVNSAFSCTCPAPAAIVEGNILIAMVQFNNISTDKCTPPAGWLQLAGVNGNNLYPMVTLWGKVATASEPADYTWMNDAGIVTGINIDIVQFQGNTTGSYLDGGETAISVAASKTVSAPGVTTTQPNDLIIAVFSCYYPGVTGLACPPGFTQITALVGYEAQWTWGYKVVPQGSTGQFNGSSPVAVAWSTATAAIRAGSSGNPPGQTLQQPTQSLTPVGAGLMSVNFGPNPLSIPGLVQWCQPETDFTWDREAPISVIQPNTYFSLAGIAPEKAAWASMMWLAIK